MRKNLSALLIALSLCAALALPIGLSAQEQKEQNEQKKQHHHYQLIDVGTFGGPSSLFSNPGDKVINNRGTATGMANTSISDPYSPNMCFYYDCLVDQAFVRKNGVTTDLGTLPGGASSFAYWVNNRGLIVGQSQNGSIDPLTGWPEADAVVWDHGQIINLWTLGGSQSNAYATNEHDQVVGGALTATPDPFANALQGACVQLPSTGFCSGLTFAESSVYFPATTETHAFLWQHGFMRDLGTLGGPDSNAFITDDHGQVAGWSYTSFVANPSTGVPTVDPFLWSPEDGKMTDLGTLGGTFGAPFFLNNRGQVVGISNLPGDTIARPFLWSKSEGMKDLGTLGGTWGFSTWVNDAGEVVGLSFLAGDQNFHAFLWRHGVMTDLGAAGTDQGSEAFSINSQGQVVGDSGSNNVDLHGFLWEHGGPVVDLNQLVPAGSGLTVVTAVFINDRGEIAGTAKLSNGDEHAVVLIPCDENHPDVEGCDYDLVEAVSEVQVRPAQITPAPAASPAKLSPAEMMTRFGSLRAGRNRRFGTPQTSPQ
jgi:probable HAF family extracellular repeat protein